MKPVSPSSASQPGRPGHGRPRVVIIGCGFGGLEAAKALDGAAVDIGVVKSFVCPVIHIPRA